MVKGIDIFRDFFREFAGNYILIGGAACDVHMSRAGLHFRATRDLDIVLVVEALNSAFIQKFWEFIKEGNYHNRQKSVGKRKYYRFIKPEKEGYPFQLELFAAKPQLLNLPDESRLTPIPAGEDISSLSAILMDEDYYNFVKEHSTVRGNLHVAQTEALICLKARAFLDLQNRRERGEEVDERSVRKHKNDVIRLAVLLTSEKSLKLPSSIALDMEKFLRVIEESPPDYKLLGKNMGIPGMGGTKIIKQLRHTYLV